MCMGVSLACMSVRHPLPDACGGQERMSLDLLEVELQTAVGAENQIPFL